jgi:hypothetical protein
VPEAGLACSLFLGLAPRLLGATGFDFLGERLVLLIKITSAQMVLKRHQLEGFRWLVQAGDWLAWR